MCSVTRLALSVVWAMLVLSGCECESERGNLSHAPSPTQVSGEPVAHDGETLTPAEQRQQRNLTALATRYYPAWQRERETDPRTKRWQALIRQNVQDNDAWRACLSDIQKALGDVAIARDGNPPMFYIPSFQVVIHGATERGSLTMVFRLSMLAPLYDYYQRVREPGTRRVRTSLVPTRETADIAERVRDIIARHFPDHRQLSPAVGAVRLPDMAIGNRSFGETTLADALFEDGRQW